MYRTVTGLALLLFCVLAAHAHAGLLGQTVTAEWYVPDNVSVIETHNLLVGPGIELPFGSIANGGNVSIDLSDTQVRFEFASLAIWSPTAVNGWRFSDTNNTIPSIVGASIASMSGGVSGLDNSDLSFTSDSVFGNFTGVTAAGAGEFWTIKIQFADVPEPSGLLLAAVGLLALTAFQSRRMRVT